MAGGGVMMITHVDRYLLLRQTLGFKLLQVTRLLRAFANFVDQRGETHISVTAAVAWATEATTPGTRYVRLQSVVQLARFLRTEDPLHEVPPLALFPATTVRPLPYIYAPEEVERLVRAAGQLHRTYPLRRETYATLFGLIAATGMRVSEALGLRLADVQSSGLLLVREAKLGKTRLVPLHPSTVDALNHFLDKRRKLPATDDHLFLASSKESVGDIRFGQFAKCMIQGDFGDVEGAEPIGFSHGEFGFVVQPLDHTAGELLFGAEVVQDQRAVGA